MTKCGAKVADFAEKAALCASGNYFFKTVRT